MDLFICKKIIIAERSFRTSLFKMKLVHVDLYEFTYAVGKLFFGFLENFG